LIRQPEWVPTAGQRPTGGQPRSPWRLLGSSSVVRLVLGVVASVGCLYLLASEVRIAAVRESMQRMDYGLLGLAMLLTLAIMLCKAARWRALYPVEKRPPLRLAIAGIAMGQVANWAIPARLGEVIRMGLVSMEGEDGDPRHRASLALSAGVLGAEKLCEGMMLLVTVGLLLLVVGIPLWISPAGLLSTAAFCLLGIAALVGWRLGLFQLRMPTWLLAQLQRRVNVAVLTKHVRAFGDGLMGWSTPAGLVQIACWSVAIWALGGLTNAVVMRSLGLSHELGASFALLAALYGAAVIPSVPGRIGVFQYVCVAVLGPFGVEFNDAVAFALALYAVVYLPPLVVGVLSVVLIWPRTQRLVGGLGQLQARIGRAVQGEHRVAQGEHVPARPARQDPAIPEPALPEQG